MGGSVAAGGSVGSGGRGGTAGRAAGGASSAGRSGAGGGGLGSGGASLGTASITFSVPPSRHFCWVSQCGEGPAISVTDSAGTALALGTSCSTVSCATCTTSPCPGFACQPSALDVTAASLRWDGGYYEGSTCGEGTACSALAYAAPGKYTATLCATPGALAGIDAGTPRCVATGPTECGSVAFDFPSTMPVSGTLGCVKMDDACLQESDCCVGADNGAFGRKLRCIAGFCDPLVGAM